MSRTPGRRPAPEAAPSIPPLWRRAQAVVAHRHARWGAPAAVALAALAIAAWTFDPKLGLSGDDTEFITLARSLAAGDGLTDTSLPVPRAATKYPFGFPLMLTPFAAALGGWDGPGSGTPDWIAMKWFVACTFAAAMALLYLLVRDAAGDGQAAVVALLAVTNPLTADYAQQVMSEVPYLALSLLALWLLGRGFARPGWRGNRWLWAGLAAALAAYYTRSVGIVLLGAAVAHLGLRRDWRRAGFVGGLCVLGMLPWALRNRAVGEGGFYFKQLLQVNPYFPDQGQLDLAGFVERVAGHVQYYLSDALVRSLWPTFAPATSALNPGSAVLLAMLGWFAYRSLRARRHQLLLVYAAFFTGTVLLWPWPGDRFFLPLVPLLLFFGVSAVADGVTALRQCGAGPVVFVFAVVLAGLALQANGRGLVQLAHAARGDYLPAWRNYYDAGLWLRGNAPADAIVSCRKAYWMHVVAGRRTCTYAFDEPAAVLADLERQGVDYVVVEQLGYAHTGRYLVPAIASAQQRFRVVWHGADPETWVFSFDGGGGR